MADISSEHSPLLSDALRFARFALVTIAAAIYPSNAEMNPEAFDEAVPVRKMEERPESVSTETVLTKLTIVPEVTQRLIMVGGGDIPAEALSTFAGWAGGAGGKLLIIPWATTTPQKAFDELKEDFQPFQLASIESAPFRDQMAEGKEKFLTQLAEATGVFFTGGDQVDAMKILADKELLSALRQKFENGTVFAGTSAGTALMSEIMITGRIDDTDPCHLRMGSAPGLGVFHGAVVDQHFLERSRLARLIEVMGYNNFPVGLGVDVDTAFAVENNRHAEVFGPSKVTLVTRVGDSDEYHVEALEPGQRYDLAGRLHLPKLPSESPSTSD